MDIGKLKSSKESGKRNKIETKNKSSKNGTKAKRTA